MAIADNTELKVVQEINMPGSVVAINVYYYLCQFSEAVTESALINALETAMENLYDNFVTLWPAEVTLGDMYVYSYVVLTDEWDLVGTGNPSVTFTSAGEMLPHGVAALVRAYTDNPRTIARKYLPCFIEDTQADGDWGSGHLTTLATWANLWTTSIEIATGKDLRPGCFSTTGKVIRLFNAEEVVLAQPAYQRRRRPGVGS